MGAANERLRKRPARDPQDDPRVPNGSGRIDEEARRDAEDLAEAPHETPTKVWERTERDPDPRKRGE